MKTLKDLGLSILNATLMLAIILDRLTQAMSQPKGRPGKMWSQGPVGLIRRIFGHAEGRNNTQKTA